MQSNFWNLKIIIYPAPKILLSTWYFDFYQLHRQWYLSKKLNGGRKQIVIYQHVLSYHYVLDILHFICHITNMFIKNLKQHRKTNSKNVLNCFHIPDLLNVIRNIANWKSGFIAENRKIVSFPFSYPVEQKNLHFYPAHRWSKTPLL